MLAILMNQGHSSVLDFVRSTQLPATQCGSCGVDRDRIHMYEEVSPKDFEDRGIRPAVPENFPTQTIHDKGGCLDPIEFCSDNAEEVLDQLQDGYPVVAPEKVGKAVWGCLQGDGDDTEMSQGPTGTHWTMPSSSTLYKSKPFFSTCKVGGNFSSRTSDWLEVVRKTHTEKQTFRLGQKANGESALGELNSTEQSRKTQRLGLDS